MNKGYWDSANHYITGHKRCVNITLCNYRGRRNCP